MFLQTWNRYLPVIKILLKRSVNAEQTLDMNSSDFQRASGGKKIKYTLVWQKVLRGVEGHILLSEVEIFFFI